MCFSFYNKKEENKYRSTFLSTIKGKDGRKNTCFFIIKIEEKKKKIQVCFPFQNKTKDEKNTDAKKKGRKNIIVFPFLQLKKEDEKKRKEKKKGRRKEKKEKKKIIKRSFSFFSFLETDNQKRHLPGRAKSS